MSADKEQRRDRALDLFLTRAERLRVLDEFTLDGVTWVWAPNALELPDSPMLVLILNAGRTYFELEYGVVDQADGAYRPHPPREAP